MNIDKLIRNNLVSKKPLGIQKDERIDMRDQIIAQIPSYDDKHTIAKQIKAIEAKLLKKIIFEGAI